MAEGIRPVFVGRETELRALDQQLGRTSGGATPLIAISGEAGIGKTRLLAELARRARARGSVVLRGHSLDIGHGIPYGPILQAIRTHVRALPDDARRSLAHRASRALRPLVPDLFGRSAPISRSGHTPEIVLAGLVDLVDLLSDTHPVVLLVEDVHSADPSTRDFLRLLTRTGERPVVPVISVRTGDQPLDRDLATLLGDLDRSDDLRRIELEGLRPPELRVLLADLLGRDLAQEDVALLCQRSQGNPYYAQELALAGGGSAALPSTLQDLLVGRLATLPASEQRLVRTLAVVGRAVPAALVGPLFGASPANLERQLKDLVVARVLEPTPALGGGGYQFRHALMQEAVYADTLPGRRLRLHAEVARAIEAHPKLLGPDDVVAATLAHHWEGAGDWDRALHWRMAAARAAEHKLAPAAAMDHLARARTLWPLTSQQARDELGDAADLELRFATAASQAGHPELARDCLDALRARTDAKRDPRRAAVIDAQRCAALWALGDVPGTMSAAELALVLAHPEQPEVRAVALRAYAGMLLVTDREEEAVGWALEGIEAARAADLHDEEAYLRTVVGAGRLRAGRLAEARREFEAAVELSGRGERGQMWHVSRMHRLVYLLWTGQLRDAEPEADELPVVAHKLGAGLGEVLGLRGLQLMAQIQAGKLAQAEVTLADLASRPPPSGPHALAEQHVSAADLAMRRGRFDDAARHLVTARELVPEPIPAWWWGLYLRVALELALWTGDLDQASRMVWMGQEKLPSSFWPGVPRFACAAIRHAADTPGAGSRRSARARHLRSAAASWLELLRTMDASAGDQAPLIRAAALEGEAEWARLVGDPASGAWVAARDAWRDAGFPFELAYAGLRLAESELRAGRRVPGIRALREADRVGQSIGAATILDAAKALADRSHVALQGATAAAIERSGAGALGLSARELDVLRLLAAGMTNRQISDHLFISAKTTETHVSHILAKLGVASRGEAAVLAVRRGIH